MFLVELVVVWKENSGEKGQIWPFLLQLRLGKPEPRFSEFFDPPRRSILGEPLRLGITLLCLGVPASPVLVPLFR